jgi:hypothetical protein
MLRDLHRFWPFMERLCGAFRELGYEIRRWTKTEDERPREAYLFKRRGKPLSLIDGTVRY